ncbi:MAG: hypothetical protein PHT84_01555 [Candidatus Pacebacteria bacterium]|nr:hypothetical protein [Candidatus Paceibacterota bacterium]
MNLGTILLASLVFFTGTIIVVLSIKNLILARKNRLYREFVKRTPVKQFIAILDSTNSKALGHDIIMMLQKYFELLLLRLDKKQVSGLLADLDKSKYSDILRKSLIKAVVETSDCVFGLALAESVNNTKDKLAIEYFLVGLPENKKREQYKTAFNVLKEEYDRKIWDHPVEFRVPVEQAMKEFEKKIL